MWMIRGSPRTPDRLPELSGSCVQLLEVFRTMTGAHGPYNLGGFATLGKPSLCSARLAVIAWPRGDAQSRARQALMKRLGITQEEGETMEMTLLRYVNLFKDPLSNVVA